MDYLGEYIACMGGLMIKIITWLYCYPTFCGSE